MMDTKTLDLLAELQRLAICCQRRTGYVCACELHAGKHGVGWSVIVWDQGADIRQLSTWRGMAFHSGRHSTAPQDASLDQARDGLTDFIAQHKREVA